MRILIITGSFPPMKCGVGDYTACLAEALGKFQNTQVAVLTSEKVCPQENAVPYELFPVVKRWKITEFVRIIKIIRQWRPNIVHIQYPTQGYAGGGRLPFLLPVLLFILNIKVVQTWHEFLTKENIQIELLPNMMIPDGLVTVRPDYKAHIPPFYRWLIRHKRFRFIPNASALSRITLSSQERLAIHARYTPPAKALLVFFGFIYAHKGIEALFEIADPLKHHIVLIGDINKDDPYHQSLRDKAQQGPWAEKITLTGFLPMSEAARILAAADAVVLPFHEGGGLWNTSLHGSAIQGTFILTTSHLRSGYDARENIYYARPGDVEDMRQALTMYAGRRNTEENISRFTTWEFIAEEHIHLYRTVLG